MNLKNPGFVFTILAFFSCYLTVKHAQTAKKWQTTLYFCPLDEMFSHGKKLKQALLRENYSA